MARRRRITMRKAIWWAEVILYSPILFTAWFFIYVGSFMKVAGYALTFRRAKIRQEIDSVMDD